MQIRALNPSGSVFAHSAVKGEDYFCPECRATLRLRGGQRRQLHFFHLRAHAECRQHQKGPEHLNLQLHLHSLLEGSQMERAFPEIGRIADVACEKTKRIFEIQVSPITAEEVRARCADYESLGFTVVWILHDKRFNKRLLSSAELILREKCRYFSNMDAKGRGIVYDQFEQIAGIRRAQRGPPLKVDLSQVFYLPTLRHAGDLKSRMEEGQIKSIPQEKSSTQSFYRRLIFQALRKFSRSSPHAF